jgi:hypothetical protein
MPTTLYGEKDWIEQSVTYRQRPSGLLEKITEYLALGKKTSAPQVAEDDYIVFPAPEVKTNSDGTSSCTVVAYSANDSSSVVQSGIIKDAQFVIYKNPDDPSQKLQGTAKYFAKTATVKNAQPAGSPGIPPAAGAFYIELLHIVAPNNSETFSTAGFSPIGTSYPLAQLSVQNYGEFDEVTATYESNCSYFVKYDY